MVEVVAVIRFQAIRHVSFHNDQRKPNTRTNIWIDFLFLLSAAPSYGSSQNYAGKKFFILVRITLKPLNWSIIVKIAMLEKTIIYICLFF